MDKSFDGLVGLVITKFYEAIPAVVKIKMVLCFAAFLWGGWIKLGKFKWRADGLKIFSCFNLYDCFMSENFFPSDWLAFYKVALYWKWNLMHYWLCIQWMGRIVVVYVYWTIFNLLLCLEWTCTIKIFSSIHFHH